MVTETNRIVTFFCKSSGGDFDAWDAEGKKQRTAE
jgi:hypothetical protein